MVYRPGAPAVSVRSTQVPDDHRAALLDKRPVRKVQQAMGADSQVEEAPFGTTTEDAQDLFRVSYRGRRVLWMPHADELKQRLLQ